MNPGVQINEFSVKTGSFGLTCQIGMPCDRAGCLICRENSMPDITPARVAHQYPRGRPHAIETLVRRVGGPAENPRLKRAIASHIAGMDIDAYMADRKIVDAVECCLERISEASCKPGPEVEQLAPAQPWRQIKDLGNALRHEYHKFRTSEIWEIATRDLPSSMADVDRALAKLRGQGGHSR